MKKANKRYQLLLHQSLAKQNLSQEIFLLLTKLSDEEVDQWFSSSVREVRSVVHVLGQVVEYQAEKRNRPTASISRLREELGQDFYLWSDAIGFGRHNLEVSSLALGLMVLKLDNCRQAAVWALRLGEELPKYTLSVNYTYRLRSFILRVSSALLRGEK